MRRDHHRLGRADDGVTAGDAAALGGARRRRFASWASGRRSPRPRRGGARRRSARPPRDRAWPSPRSRPARPRPQRGHALAVGGVEVAGRLVGEQHARPRREARRQRDALLLAARQLLDQVAPTPPARRAPGRRRYNGAPARPRPRPPAAARAGSPPRSATRPGRCPGAPARPAGSRRVAAPHRLVGEQHQPEAGRSAPASAQSSGTSAPDGPVTDTSCPGWTTRSTSRTATRSPYVTRTSSARSSSTVGTSCPVPGREVRAGGPRGARRRRRRADPRSGSAGRPPSRPPGRPPARVAPAASSPAREEVLPGPSSTGWKRTSVPGWRCSRTCSGSGRKPSG